MKFSHSDRILHNIKFNPPCNYYNLDKKQAKKVLHGSLAGPKMVDEIKNTFSYQKRFDEQKMKKTPGPGQYFDKKKEITYDFKNDLSNPKKFLKNTFRSQQQNPSIPYKILNQQNLDEEDKIFIRQLDLLQNPLRASQHIRKKDPSYSFTKSTRKLLPQIQQNKKQILSQTNSRQNNLNSKIQKITQKQDHQSLQENKRNKKQQNSRKCLIAVNEAIRKASKKRNQIINNIGSDFVPSLQLIDLMSKRRTKYAPGPGFYNPNDNQFGNQVDGLIQTNKKGGIFSTVKRFNVDKKSILGPGCYEVQNQSFSKKGGLMGKEKREILNTKQKKDLEYRFYINPDMESKTNVNSISQRSSSCVTFRKRNMPDDNENSGGFGSSSRRFSVASSINKDEDDKRSHVSQYEMQKKKAFKMQLKARIHKLNSEDRRSTKQDSGLLGISTMATLID